MEKIHTEVVNVDDLVQDNHNFNAGTKNGTELLERSFKDYGAGRSVLIDKNNRLVGGNKAQKGFKAAGYNKVIIVDSDPDTLVAVRRKDVDLDSKEGREMALLDNLTTQVNLCWDRTEFQQVETDVEGFNINDFGFDMPDVNIDEFFEDIENHTDKAKGFKVTVCVPPEHNDKQNEIVSIITEALKEFNGIKIN